jgi:hypothetical protein
LGSNTEEKRNLVIPEKGEFSHHLLMGGREKIGKISID